MVDLFGRHRWIRGLHNDHLLTTRLHQSLRGPRIGLLLYMAIILRIRAFVLHAFLKRMQPNAFDGSGFLFIGEPSRLPTPFQGLPLGRPFGQIEHGFLAHSID